MLSQILPLVYVDVFVLHLSQFPQQSLQRVYDVVADFISDSKCDEYNYYQSNPKDNSDNEDPPLYDLDTIHLGLDL